MFCSNCGEKLKQDSLFCSHCGEKVPSAQPQMTGEQPQPQMSYSPVQQIPASSREPGNKNPKGKYMLFGACGLAAGAILMAVLLLVTGMFGKKDSSVTFEGPGFNTPEDAATAYLMGLKEQDWDKMISSFAVESYVDNFNFNAQLERMGMYMNNLEILFPNVNDYTRRLNIANRYNYIARQIMYQYMNFNTPEFLSLSDYKELEDADAVEDFVKRFKRDAKNNFFEDLKIIETLEPDDLFKDGYSKVYKGIVPNHAKMMGVDSDDIINVAISFSAGGKTWVFCPQLIKYNGKWYLQSLNGILASLLYFDSVPGGIVRLDRVS